jgi:uncharacterized iron-regulated membrane protein
MVKAFQVTANVRPNAALQKMGFAWFLNRASRLHNRMNRGLGLDIHGRLVSPSLQHGAGQHGLAQATTATAVPIAELPRWQRWLHHPETLPVHKFLFQLHLWMGMLASLYVFAISLSGSAIVFRNQFEASGNARVLAAVESLVRFHSNLFAGDAGRLFNGAGAIVVTLLCLTGIVIWWPGVDHWRRSLTVNWSSSFARINWDLHNLLGFWLFLFVFLWGISGMYFAFPDAFNRIVDATSGPDSGTKLRLGDQLLTWISNLHFGRFNLFTQAIWVLAGLVPAVLSFTGMFMCCHRILIRKGAPLPH